jgi:hypothetical protein
MKIETELNRGAHGKESHTFLGCIDVTIMMFSAVRTNPFPEHGIFHGFIPVTTTRTKQTEREGLVHYRDR